MYRLMMLSMFLALLAMPLLAPGESPAESGVAAFDPELADIEEARALVATDPVIIKGEMAAEYHAYYGSAALPLLRDIYARIAKQQL